jgi:hypothetical protein
MELWEKWGKISTADKVSDKKTNEKGDEEGRVEKELRWKQDSNSFINGFPSQPAHDDIIRAFRVSLGNHYA